MAFSVGFFPLRDPAFSAAEGLLRLRSSDSENPPTKTDPRKFSDAVLEQYYNLCLAARLIPATEAEDPKWAENHLHEHPSLKEAAATIVAARRALETRAELAEGALSALRTRVTAFEARGAEYARPYSVLCSVPIVRPTPTISGAHILVGAGHGAHIAIGPGTGRSSHGVVPGGRT